MSEDLSGKVKRKNSLILHPTLLSQHLICIHHCAPLSQFTPLHSHLPLSHRLLSSSGTISLLLPAIFALPLHRTNPHFRFALPSPVTSPAPASFPSKLLVYIIEEEEKKERIKPKLYFLKDHSCISNHRSFLTSA